VCIVIEEVYRGGGGIEMVRSVRHGKVKYFLNKGQNGGHKGILCKRWKGVGWVGLKVD